MSNEPRLKRLEAHARPLSKERAGELPRVAANAHQQTLFDAIKTLNMQLTRPGTSIRQRHRDVERFGAFTHAMEVG